MPAETSGTSLFEVPVKRGGLSPETGQIPGSNLPLHWGHNVVGERTRPVDHNTSGIEVRGLPRLPGFPTPSHATPHSSESWLKRKPPGVERPGHRIAVP